MAERYLIDSSAAIKYLNETFSAAAILFLDEIVDTESIISFISEIELQVWSPANAEDISIYQSFVAGSLVIGIHAGIIQQTIIIRKMYKLKLPDAIIAATAIDNNFTLIADNDADFKKVPGLKYINPVQIN